jgi:hypothetical protein
MVFNISHTFTNNLKAVLYLFLKERRLEEKCRSMRMAF